MTVLFYNIHHVESVEQDIRNNNSKNIIIITYRYFVSPVRIFCILYMVFKAIKCGINAATRDMITLTNNLTIMLCVNSHMIIFKLNIPSLATNATMTITLAPRRKCFPTSSAAKHSGIVMQKIITANKAIGRL